ncbi:MAG TPA: GatB/YqeY domain-containing protein [Rhodanobacter sp.]|nr:GatB/YqeY domain-containing protein [Rhodanobacter sp.]
MTLKQQLTEDMKTAMRGGDKDRLGVIRLMLAAIKQHEVDDRVEQTDAMVLATLEKMMKQRKDSVSQFDAAGRDDLAAIERAEIAVIETYLPAKLNEAEIDALIAAAIGETGASSPRDMGKVVAAVKEKAAGRADMAVVSGKIKARLAG